MVKCTAQVAVALVLAAHAPAVDLRPQEPIARIDFSAQIGPILARCVTCHGPDEQEGELRLDTRENALRTDEPVVTPGQPDQSLLWRRITLPTDDPDRMPAEGDPLRPEELELVRQWISQGADWPDGVVLAAPAPAAVSAVVVELPALTAAQTAARDRALAALRSRGALAAPIAADTEAVEVSFARLGDAVGDADLALLEGLEPALVWLDLSQTKIGPTSISQLARFTQLRRLNLAKTAIDDSAVPHLLALERLDTLNLWNTGVGDAGVAQLAGLANLRRLFVWQTAVSDAGIAQLRSALPALHVDRGDAADALERASQASAPVNTTCPLTDKPVDPAYTFRSDGRVIGFCCGDCRAKFAEAPAQYAEKLRPR